MGLDERRSERANVILTAFVEYGPARIPVRIGNVSEHGALVIGRELPPSDTTVTFHCNGLAVQSFVAWSNAGRAGIQFESRVDPTALKSKIRKSEVAIVKAERNQDFRRPGFRGNQMTAVERRIVADAKRTPRDPS